MISCSQDQTKSEEPIIISGTIDNSNEESLYLAGIQANDEIQISEDGSFIDTLESGKGYYSIYYGRDRVRLFLKDGDQIELKADGNDFSSTVSLSGDGTEIATYFKNKSIVTDSLKGGNADFYVSEETDFGKKALALKVGLLDCLQSSSSLSQDFKQVEEKNIHFNYLSNLANYEGAHEYYADEEGFKASGAFDAIIDQADLDNEDNYNSVPAYKELISSKYGSKMYGDEVLETMGDVLKLKSPSIKTSLGKMIAYNISPGNDQNQQLVDGVKKLVTDAEYLSELDEKYGKIQNLVAGSPSPKFDGYEDHAGGTKSLEDYKGKYVYIDVWATWCGPCIGEIPHLKEVEKTYHGKNVEFVSISIDKKKDRDKWLSMIDTKELGGSQLMADNAWKSSFVVDYVIEGIPRFILVDPEGNIVSGDAPRPSDDKLIEMLTENGI